MKWPWWDDDLVLVESLWIPDARPALALSPTEWLSYFALAAGVTLAAITLVCFAFGWG